jgi:hypothetical protein
MIRSVNCGKEYVVGSGQGIGDDRRDKKVLRSRF